MITFIISILIIVVFIFIYHFYKVYEIKSKLLIKEEELTKGLLIDLGHTVLALQEMNTITIELNDAYVVQYCLEYFASIGKDNRGILTESAKTVAKKIENKLLKIYLPK